MAVADDFLLLHTDGLSHTDYLNDYTVSAAHFHRATNSRRRGITSRAVTLVGAERELTGESLFSLSLSLSLSLPPLPSVSLRDFLPLRPLSHTYDAKINVYTVYIVVARRKRKMERRVFFHARVFRVSRGGEETVVLRLLEIDRSSLSRAKKEKCIGSSSSHRIEETAERRKPKIEKPQPDIRR